MRQTLKNSALACLFSLTHLPPCFAHDHTARVGVLIGSYGDVDREDEIPDFVKRTLSDPDVVPLPRWFRSIISEFGYRIRKQAIREEYREIGGRTNFRMTTSAQAEAVAESLREIGVDAKGYAGFTMTFPFVKEALGKAQADGINQLIVFYQGAQYSRPTAYIVFRHVAEYLEQHPEWDVDIVGVRSFTDDKRFLDYLVDNLRDGLEREFRDAKPEDVCLFLPVHGNITVWEDRGDPYRKQITRVMQYLRDRFPKHYVAYGFQNHDEIPFIKWTKPSWKTVIEDLATRKCSKILASGQISFTVDSLETLFDHSIEAPRLLSKISSQLGTQKTYALVPMFNNSPRFALLLRDLSMDALNGIGDLLKIKPGKSPE